MNTVEKSIRVLIVDDHNMVRRGLTMLLEAYRDIAIVGEVGDSPMAFKLCEEKKPDVILMDMQMPHMNGIEATKLIRETFQEAKVLALTSFSEEDNVQQMLQAGAVGYLMKDITGDELAEAIRRAYQGETTLSPAAAQVLIRATVRPPAPGHDLTDREREVLAP